MTLPMPTGASWFEDKEIWKSNRHAEQNRYCWLIIAMLDTAVLTTRCRFSGLKRYTSASTSERLLCKSRNSSVFIYCPGHVCTACHSSTRAYSCSVASKAGSDNLVVMLCPPSPTVVGTDVTHHPDLVVGEDAVPLLKTGGAVCALKRIMGTPQMMWDIKDTMVTRNIKRMAANGAIFTLLLFTLLKLVRVGEHRDWDTVVLREILDKVLKIASGEPWESLGEEKVPEEGQTL